MHRASIHGKLDIIKYLIEEYHSNVEEIENNGRTPLHSASWIGQLNIVKYLVEECHAQITDEIIFNATSSIKEYLKSKR